MNIVNQFLKLVNKEKKLSTVALIMLIIADLHWRKVAKIGLFVIFTISGVIVTSELGLTLVGYLKHAAGL